MKTGDFRGPARLLAVAGFLSLVLAAVTASAQAPAASVPPSHTIKTVYIMPSSHWDLGFQAPPEQVLPRLKAHIDEVIRNCKADPEFRWTIESAWQVREWLARTHDPQEIADFVRLVKSGQIQLSAVYGSMHTEFMGAEALNRITYDMKSIEKRLGVTTDYAMMDDVPGFTSRLPQVLARSGVKYFVNGSNLFIGGGTSLYPGREPFYWEAPDGSKVLTWQTQSPLGGYTEAMAEYYLDPEAFEPYTREHFYPKEWEGLPRLEIMQRGMNKLLEKYEKAGYPYDAVLLLYMHDFISSDWERDTLLPAVREWNAAGRTPRIVVATPAEFFLHMEGEYDGKFGTYAGDWSGLWSEVKTNSPRDSAGARWVQDHWPVAEMLWSLLTFRDATSFPAGNFEDDRLKIFKYDEHSGSGQVGWPGLMSRAEIDEQNRQYAEYTSSARQDVAQNLDQGMQTLFAQTEAKDTATRIVVFNPMSWPRTDVVRVNAPEGLAVRDAETGKAIASQRAGSDDLEFVAADVPGVGYKTYVLEAGAPAGGSRSRGSYVVENGFYRVTVRPTDGAITGILDKRLGIELLDPGQATAANQLLRGTMFTDLPVPIGAVSMELTGGEVSTRLTIGRPGTFLPETRITLYREVPRIEIADRLDRARMPYVASLQPGEQYSFAFPFKFDGPATVWIEDGLGYHRLPDDYLPGARLDAAAPLHSLVLSGFSGGRPLHVVLAHRQSFFANLPALPDAKGQRTFLNQVRFAALRKQDEGDTRDLGMVNFPSVEPGLEHEPLWFDFVLTSGGDFDPAAGYREGWDFDVPLIAATLLPGMTPAQAEGSFFTLSAPNVAVLAFMPSADGDPNDYMLRLQEIAGKAADVELTTPVKITAAATTSMTEDAILQKLPAAPVRVRLGPHETVTLRLTIPHHSKSWSKRWWEWK